MVEFTKVKAGIYTTKDGKIIIEKDDGFWYAYDRYTHQSVVDSERTLREIKCSVDGFIRSHS